MKLTKRQVRVLFRAREGLPPSGRKKDWALMRWHRLLDSKNRLTEEGKRELNIRENPVDISCFGSLVAKDAIVQIWEDNDNERLGFYRAFWCASPEATSGSPVIGYCSPGGSHRTIRATMEEVLRLHPEAKVYRSGRRWN